LCCAEKKLGIEPCSENCDEFRNKKGYGFIGQEDGPDVSVHHFGINKAGFKPLNEGDRVTFDIERAQKGPAAVNETVV